MILNYYIDESGNSGDVLNTGNDFDFCGQPVFSLACIGVRDAQKLCSFIVKKKDQYNLQGEELKSSKIYKKKPKFIVELVEYLAQEKIPIFIEVVDKKYFISANMVNCHVMPAHCFPPETQQSQLVRNQCADFIYENAPSSVFNKFIIACRQPSCNALVESFEDILNFSKNFTPNNPLANFLMVNIKESIDDYEKLREQAGDKACERFLPVPDNSKKDKSIWMLPNLSCFTSMYSRINLYLNGNVAGVNLFHDEQAHFDEIILLNKKLLEELDTSNAISIKTAKYEFTEEASLSFSKSHEQIPIQVADILAGLVMRRVQEKIHGVESNPEVIEAYNSILRISNPNLGLGINLVVTSKLHRELHFSI